MLLYIYIVQAISSSCGEKWLGNNLNHAHLDYFYWVLAGLSTLNLCVYIGIAMRFAYKKVEGGDILLLRVFFYVSCTLDMRVIGQRLV